jgi:hypothetical protein
MPVFGFGIAVFGFPIDVFGFEIEYPVIGFGIEWLCLALE